MPSKEAQFASLIISIIILIIVIILIIIVCYNYKNENNGPAPIIKNPKLAAAAIYAYKNKFKNATGCTGKKNNDRCQNTSTTGFCCKVPYCMASIEYYMGGWMRCQ